MLEAAIKPDVQAFFDKRTNSVQYVVADPVTRHCAIIDSVLDFDEKSGATATLNADRILEFVDANGLKVEWILETHPHADHFSAADYLRTRTGATTAIGGHIVEVQALWKQFYNWPDFPADGSQWDHLFHAGDRFNIGKLTGVVMFSPGHTLASITYVIGDCAFIHDTMFMPDGGTARCDFPGEAPSIYGNPFNPFLRSRMRPESLSATTINPGGVNLAGEPLWSTRSATISTYPDANPKQSSWQ